MITFKDARLGHAGEAVLENVNWEVASGSFSGILGHNGSGKTTLLKSLMGLIPCLGGELIRRGVHFGYVPQKERLDPIYPLSAYAVAEMGTYRQFEFRPRRGEERALVQRCLADCGAAELAEQRFSELSGGQRQRVLIARALAARPNILALDEPLAGIDITTQQALLALLKELKEKRKLTVLMVSHRVSAERGLFTHIVWVDDGVVSAGPSETMLGRGRLAEIFKAEL